MWSGSVRNLGLITILLLLWPGCVPVSPDQFAEPTLEVTPSNPPEVTSPPPTLSPTPTEVPATPTPEVVDTPTEIPTNTPAVTPSATPTPTLTPIPSVDADGDGYFAGSPPEGQPTDCDDSNAQVYPGAPEQPMDGVDQDCDGKDLGDADRDGYPSTGIGGNDCQDEDSSVHPGAPEACDNKDNDCDQQVDEGLSHTFYADVDHDGYGDSGSPLIACQAPPGYVVEAGDCLDSDVNIHPGAPELCDGVDNDCDGQNDEDALKSWYPDKDKDGYGLAEGEVLSCASPQGYISSAGDCNDLDASIHPGASETNCSDNVDRNCDGSVGTTDGDGDGAPACLDCDDTDPLRAPDKPEVCNGIDDNCDGTVDGADAVGSLYVDSDGDGFGDGALPTGSCDSGNGVLNGTDCNDGDSAIFPGQLEQCNGLDDNCDGSVDEGLSSAWYQDMDEDGFGDPAQSTWSCSLQTGQVRNGDDCDDTQASVSPMAAEQCNGVDDNCDGVVDEGVVQTFYLDGDGDGFGVAGSTSQGCTLPEGYATVSGDCNDASSAILPSALELCNGLDDDCDGVSDEGLAQQSWYPDGDGDGHGSSEASISSCLQPQGYSGSSDDCQDENALIFPGAPEQCNNADDDCDGQVDESVQAWTWYQDQDGDGQGVSGTSLSNCAQPEGFVANSTDCNDAEATIYLGAPELCNKVDDDCDGVVDDAAVPVTWYADADGDGYGDALVTSQSCVQPAGYVRSGTDCNDRSKAIYPGALEACNGVDDNCDAQIDEGLATSTYYADADKDGFGDATVTTVSCSMPAGYAATDTDCADGDATRFPGATESCNGLDDDCDGQADESAGSIWYADTDSDGFGSSTPQQACSAPAGYVSQAGDCQDTQASVYPGAIEVCNSVDDDCDGLVDDGAGSSWYLDQDRDGFGTPTKVVQSCTQPTGYVAVNTDCDDTLASVNPNMTEQCNARDDDCDALVDEGVKKTFYQDNDLDGYGTADVTTKACTAPVGYAANGNDCDDTSSNIHPGATEQCNGKDDDCDNVIDDGIPLSQYYADHDGDGAGDTLSWLEACVAPADYVATGGDCDDGDDTVYPGAFDTVGDGTDANCDGLNDSLLAVAGTGFFNGDGLYGTSSPLASPGGMARGADGALYIADTLNHRIRKYDLTSKNLVTVAGTGYPGFSGDGGPAVSAQLSSPRGLLVLSSGALVVADSGNNRLRIVQDGTISTLAGDGSSAPAAPGASATAVGLVNPTALAADSKGNVCFSETGGHRVWCIRNDKLVLLAGTGKAGFSGDGGVPGSAQLNGPRGLAFQVDILYIADTQNNRIRRVIEGALVTTYAGTGTAGNAGDGDEGAKAQLNRPEGLGLNGANLIVADTGNNRLRLLPAATGVIVHYAGDPAGTAGYSGEGLARLSSKLSGPQEYLGGATELVADSGNHRIRLLTSSSTYTIVGNGTHGYDGDDQSATTSRINAPVGMAFSAAGELYFADAANHRVRAVSGLGIIRTVVGTGTAGSSGDNGDGTKAQLNTPADVAFDPDGNLYIADSYNHRVRRVAAVNGKVTTVVGTGTNGFSGDGGQPSKAQLSYPAGLWVASSGLYVADTANHRVRLVSSSTINTVAGSSASGYAGDNGLATQARLNKPRGLWVDASGALFISDTDNHAIRKVDASSRIITTVVGTGASGKGGDGACDGLALSSPLDVVGNGRGGLYVADQGNGRLIWLENLSDATPLCLTMAGTGALGTGYSGSPVSAEDAQILGPAGLWMTSAGELYVSELAGGRVSRIRP